ncbi:MAG: T9SS type A sorting domain-containing protein [Bacteroidia bacterium]|nr:T9SS type A sorting domain-containing protein [Bacteroidia bacterium]MBP7262365.1 T9SS type A sorting domain-containing protein [Bacteroidia bacterium]MBP9180466.1 T9SS type A sorting domain-containing protein [Bacteroidia bacterium]MBP9724990.1 T9SS type A sorting domain-containing protein [Bacteroidia bacterium]
MRKIYLVLSLLAASLVSAYAQCTPRAGMTNYIEPEFLDNAIAGSAYSQVVYFRVPKDTILSYNGTPVAVSVQNSKILAMEGIPSGFVYNCNKANCNFAGGSNGCAVITGTPTLAQVGDYPIKIRIQTNTLIGGTIPLSRIDSGIYDFKILATVSTGPQIGEGKLFSVYPNPANQSIQLKLAPISNTGKLTVCNLLGNVVLEKELGVSTTQSDENINSSQWPSGLYLIQLKSGDKLTTHKILVKH